MRYSKRVLANADLETLNNYSIQLNRWYLMLLGVWPQTSTWSTLKKIVASMLIFIFTITSAMITIPCILYMCFEKENIRIKLKTVVSLCHRIVGISNYWMLFRYNDDIHNCLRHIETDWKLAQRNDDREVMLQHAKNGRFVAGCCGAFMHCATFYFSIVQATKTITFAIGNETFTMHPMTCPMYSKIIDVRFSPANEIILVVQFVSATGLGSATVAFCSLAAVFAMHACGQLNVLHSRLHELVDDHEKKTHPVEQKLSTIVEHHLRVLSFIACMEKIMHKSCLVQLVGSTLNMCFLGYYSVTNWATFDAAKMSSFAITYISMTFNIFIFCYIGEILTEQCKNVGEVAYMTDWYKLHHKTALCLILIIMRSSYVIKITAGKIFQLSIATFGDIIKTSMAYLNILRTIT